MRAADDAWTPPACPEHDRSCDPLVCPALWPPVRIPELAMARDRKLFEARIARNADRTRRALWPDHDAPLGLDEGRGAR